MKVTHKIQVKTYCTGCGAHWMIETVIPLMESEDRGELLYHLEICPACNEITDYTNWYAERPKKKTKKKSPRGQSL